MGASGVPGRQAPPRKVSGAFAFLADDFNPPPTTKGKNMNTAMRAKMQVGFVQQHFHGQDGAKSQETLSMHAVCAKSYPADGTDEDNTFARWSPGANLQINVANPALWDKFKVGDKFYVDFTPADRETQTIAAADVGDARTVLGI
jgi:hypothetical protein